MVDYVKDFLLKKEDPYAKSVDAYINNPSMSSPIYMAQPEQPKVDLSNAINSAMRNWGAAMDARNSLNTAEGARQEPQEVGEVETFDVNSLKPQQAPQEVNLKQAEQELREAQELDKQSGSEGYEAKPDGIFDRLKGFGATIIGKQGLQDWEDFKKDFEERGIGAVTQRANSLMEDMARSPFSKFVDPTTLLGGRRTMVNDIDSYFNQQGLPALRNELLAQDIARLKTPIGQAEEWAKKTPEQQAAMKPYFEMKGTGGYTGVGAKNPLQAAQRQVVSLVNDGVPMQEALQQVSDDTGIPANEILYGATSRPNIKTPLQLAQRAVVDRVNNGENLSDALQSVAAETGYPINVLSGEKAPSTYKATSAEEKINVAQREGFAKAYSTRVGKKLDEVEAPDYDNTLRDLVGFYEYLSDPRNKDVVGGPLNTTIKQFASSLGVSDKDQDAFLASFLQSQRAMHAVAIRQINQSGATNAEEQRNAARSIIDINKGYDYNKKMVEQTISNMALAQAMTKDEYYLAEGGGSKKDNDALLRRKYGAMIHDPNKFIDPRLVDLHLGEDGEYAYSPSVNGFVFGREE